MKPLLTTFNVREIDNIDIIHIGSTRPVTVWLTDALFTDGPNCIVMVSGRVQADGYLPVKVEVNNRVVYPKGKLCCLISNMSVSLQFNGASQDRISETFLCSERDKDRVIYARYRKSVEFCANDDRRALYLSKMAEIKKRWDQGP